MYYMAYGSNLNKGQMRYRCPQAKPITTATLEGWKLVFKGSKTGAYLTIEEAEGYSVPVAIWRVSAKDEHSLDVYEGYPRFYGKVITRLKCDDGKVHKVFVYIMREDRIIGVPSEHYVQTCLEGYRDFGFDPEILRKAENYIEGRGSISLVNDFEICSDCGIRQSLACMGIDAEEQNKILAIVHSHYKWLKERGLEEV